MENNKPIIMIVDDQPDLIEGIKIILEEENYEVWTALNGQLALNQLESAFSKRRQGDGSGRGRLLPDLILADIMMPIMDGYELHERVRANPYLNHIPFVFLTAKGAVADIRQGKALGVDDYLTKPCLPDDLLATVQGKLKRTRQQRAIREQFMEDLDKMPAAGIIVMISLAGTVIVIIIATVIITLALAG